MKHRLVTILPIFIVVLISMLAIGQISAQDSESSEPVFEEFDPTNFDNPTTIDNRWFPMQPGTHRVLEGITVEDGEEIPHRIEFTVTDLTKEIAGVETVVAWIVDISDGEAIEKEIAFYAQDNDGAVWYFGERPEEYEEGEIVAAPTWIAGLEDALPGVIIRAEPQLEAPTVFQGWGPAVEWTDYSIVDALGQETCVPVDCYEDVVVIAESSLEEENIFQLKYYAPGVGNVRVGFRGEDATQEELEMVDFRQLDEDEMAAVREEVMEVEARLDEYIAEQSQSE